MATSPAPCWKRQHFASKNKTASAGGALLVEAGSGRHCTSLNQMNVRPIALSVSHPRSFLNPTSLALLLLSGLPSALPAASWQSQDIGAVAAAGHSTESGGAVSIAASGADIWNAADEFHFRSQPWTGDGEFIARLNGLTATDPWAKAGLMFRDSLQANSAHAMVAVAAGQGAMFQYRQSAGGLSNSNVTGGGNALPRWLKIVRAGNTFTGYASTDGVNWSLSGTTSWVPTGATIWVGLAVTSHRDGVLTTAGFDQVLLNGTSTTEPVGTPAAPSGLRANAISNSQVELTWSDESGNETGFQIERSTAADSEFTNVTTTAANTRRFVDAGLSSGTPLYYRIRAMNGGVGSAFTEVVSTYVPFTNGPTVPGTLAATVGGATITLQWTNAGGGQMWWQVERSIDNVAFAELSKVPAGTNSIHDTGDSGATYYYRVRAMDGGGVSPYSNIAQATLGSVEEPPPDTGGNEGWNSQDIGAVAAAGSTSGGTDAVLTLTGSGADIWGSADEFRFHSRSWTGDGEFIARVGSLTQTNGWAKAGIMLRESAQAGARHVFIAITPGNGVQFQRRAATSSESTSGSWSTAPRWLRLVRSGNVFTGYESADGVNWTHVGAATIALPAAIHAGFAITSHQDGVLGTATFDQIAFTGGAVEPPPPPPPDEPLPPDTAGTWFASDIGAVGVAGSNAASGNTLTVSGSGADIWEGADGFRFVYQTLSGDCTVEAQVSSMSATHPWAKAGVMIRESNAANARNVMALLTPSNGAGAQARISTGGATTFTPGPWGAGIPYWVRLVRTGDQIAAYTSPNGSAWTLLASYTLAMSGPVDVGFAVTSHANAQLNTTVFTDPYIE